MLDHNGKARTGLRGAPSAAGRGVVRQSPATRRATARKAAAVVVELRDLAQLLRASSDGLSAAALAKETNGRPDQIRALLRDLEAAGKVRRTGQRRGTRWHVITDDDWIAQRASELAARSKTATVDRKAA
jgi:hypothetical protein